MIEVNSLGKFQRSLGINPSRQGKDIQLNFAIFPTNCDGEFVGDYDQLKEHLN